MAQTLSRLNTRSTARSASACPRHNLLAEENDAATKAPTSGWFFWCTLLLTCVTFGFGTRMSLLLAQKTETAEIIENASRHQNLGLAYLEESQPTKALGEFEALIALLPDEAIGYGNLAVAHLRLQQADAAEAVVKRGIQAAPMDSQLHFILSEVYQLQGKTAQAVVAMTESTRLAPDNLEFRYKLARHYLGQRNNLAALQEAVTHLQVLHDISPANIVVLMKLAQARLSLGEREEAKELGAELHALLWDTDEEKLTYLTQGMALIEQGDVKTASRNFRIFENLHRATPRYQQGIGELVTDILGHPIETFSPGFKARLMAKQTEPIPVQFVDITAAIGLENRPVPKQDGQDGQDGQDKEDARLQSAPTLVLADTDGDGWLDIYLSPTATSPSTLGTLFQGKNSGDAVKFVEAKVEAMGELGAHAKVFGAAFADLDKDGTQELLLLEGNTITRVRLLEGDTEGDMNAIVEGDTDAGARLQSAPTVVGAPTEKSEGWPTCLLPIDAEHDGDLDLFVGDTVGQRMYRNNGDGTFTDVSEQVFIMGSGLQDTVARGDVNSDGPRDAKDARLQSAPTEINSGATAALAADFDDDGDIDIFVTHEETGCTLWDNLRQGRFRARTDDTGIAQDAHYSAAAAGDYDNDGNVDICLITERGYHLYRNRGDGSFVEGARLQSAPTVFEQSAPTVVQNIDYDNDGFVDIWMLGEGGMSLLRNDGTGRFTEVRDSLPPDIAGIAGAVGDVDNDGALDLFLIDSDGYLRVLQNRGGNENNWIQVKLEGITAGNNKINRDGLGSKLEVKVGDLYQVQYVSQQVSHFGLGAFEAADVVRVVWTNGVPQNVIAPKARQRILEKQILKGSCPFLYTYDGERYRFVTDLLWRAPLGLLTSMGFVAPDETKDFVKIPASHIQPKGGRYSIQITEELWETAYFDMVKLIAVDHPAGTEVFVNEQYTPPPFADFKVYGVAEKLHPKSAFNHRGEEVSEALHALDYRYAVEHAPGIHQGVVEPHAVILDLGDMPKDTPKNTPITLFLSGWIFPTDTSINVALFQNPAISPKFPSVSVKNEAGEWETVIEMIGLPAGKNKTITVPLTGKFLSDDSHVRIDTDLQIYWDAAFFTRGEQAGVPMHITELTPDSADLHYRGFSAMYRPTPHAPHLFDYEKVTTAAQWRDLEGHYTRYGDVNPLLQEVDDMYVILNAGDEITVEFAASRLPALKAGWVRDFILYSDGWDKDGDINTLTSQTVEPLPFHGMSAYPYPKTERYPDDAVHRRYRLEYNTRRVKHRLPPLPGPTAD